MNIFKYFRSENALEGGQQAESVSKGTCFFETESGEKHKYECVEKVYVNQEEFNRAVRAFEYLDTKDDLRSFFPDVYHKDEDKEKPSVKMAYFHYKTIANFFETTNIYAKENHWMINGVLFSLNRMLDALIKNKVSHGDLNAQNVLVCPSKSNQPMVELKIVDVDDLTILDDDIYADSATLSTEIRGYIRDNVSSRNLELSRNELDYDSKVEDSYKSRKISKKKRDILKEKLGEHVRKEREILTNQEKISSINEQLESFSNCGMLSMRTREDHERYNIPEP